MEEGEKGRREEGIAFVYSLVLSLLLGVRCWV
jgi:hypothetical protein